MFEDLSKKLEKKKYVWYCCYGSNLTRDRFLAYITGGDKVVKGKTLHEKGCTDKSLPIKEKATTISHELYFSGSSYKWDGMGVAFIDSKSNPNIKTYAKMYLITLQPFLEVTSQENDSLEISKISKAMKRAIKKGESNIDEVSTYGKMLYLGKDEGYPILTFTSLMPLKNINKPCGKYIKMISDGLKETHGLSNRKMLKYFKSTLGSKDYTKNDLRSAISKGQTKSEAKIKRDYSLGYSNLYEYYSNGYYKYCDYYDDSYLDSYMYEKYKKGEITQTEYEEYLDEICERDIYL